MQRDFTSIAFVDCISFRLFSLLRPHPWVSVHTVRLSLSARATAHVLHKNAAEGYLEERRTGMHLPSAASRATGKRYPAPLPFQNASSVKLSLMTTAMTTGIGSAIHEPVHAKRFVDLAATRHGELSLLSRSEVLISSGSFL